MELSDLSIENHTNGFGPIHLGDHLKDMVANSPGSDGISFEPDLQQRPCEMVFVSDYIFEDATLQVAAQTSHQQDPVTLTLLQQQRQLQEHQHCRLDSDQDHELDHHCNMVVLHEHVGHENGFVVQNEEVTQTAELIQHEEVVVHQSDGAEDDDAVQLGNMVQFDRIGHGGSMQVEHAVQRSNVLHLDNVIQPDEAMRSEGVERREEVVLHEGIVQFEVLRANTVQEEEVPGGVRDQQETNRPTQNILQVHNKHSFRCEEQGTEGKYSSAQRSGGQRGKQPAPSKYRFVCVCGADFTCVRRLTQHVSRCAGSLTYRDADTRQHPRRSPSDRDRSQTARAEGVNSALDGMNAHAGTRGRRVTPWDPAGIPAPNSPDGATGLGQGPPRCSYCFTDFASVEALRRHKSASKGGVRACGRCGQSLECLMGVEYHRRVGCRNIRRARCQTSLDGGRTGTSKVVSSDHAHIGDGPSLVSDNNPVKTRDHPVACSGRPIASNEHPILSHDHGNASNDHTIDFYDHLNASHDHRNVPKDHTIASNNHGNASSNHRIHSIDNGNTLKDLPFASNDHRNASDDYPFASNDRPCLSSNHPTTSNDLPASAIDHPIVSTSTSAQPSTIVCDNQGATVDASSIFIMTSVDECSNKASATDGMMLSSVSPDPAISSVVNRITVLSATCLDNMGSLFLPTSAYLVSYSNEHTAPKSHTRPGDWTFPLDVARDPVTAGSPDEETSFVCELCGLEVLGRRAWLEHRTSAHSAEEREAPLASEVLDKGCLQSVLSPNSVS